MPCACGSAREVAACCGALLSGERTADTAEALMRSRYTAFVRGNVDYLLETHDPRTAGAVSRKGLESTVRGTRWLGLDVLDVVGGRAEDEDGEVEFVARYRERGRIAHVHERSSFRRVDGRWVYTSGRPGELQVGAPAARDTPVGRNDPCPCGSGRKYKRCCA